jgi:hypothetical protein
MTSSRMLDDEFDIMNIFTRALQQQGFRVIDFTEPILMLDHFHLYSLVVSYQDARNGWM